MTDPVLEVRDLSVAYSLSHGSMRAVDHVDFDVGRGEFVGIVGESGCGKSTLLFAIAQLLGPPAIIEGVVRFNGSDLVTMSPAKLRAVRWREFSVVMQSAMNALNPVLQIGTQFRDALRAHGTTASDEIRSQSERVMALVGIDTTHLRSYPHQLSGGMRQRIMIAMALLFSPDLVMMDEPTSALDVVAQRSLMVQIKELQHELGFAVIFVTHDMSLVSHFSDRTLVMYAGQVVEIGATRAVFDSPAHPYSRGLLEAFPSIHGPRLPLTGIPGGPPSLAGRVHWLPLRSEVPIGAGTVRDRRTAVVRRPGGSGPMSVARTGGRAVIAAHEPPLLEAREISRHFKVGGALGRKTLHAVDEASFVIGEHEIVALVGESGSGKSTIARLLARVYTPSSGEIFYRGRPLGDIRSRRDSLAYRSDVPMVFQDPFSALSPAYRVSHGIMRGLKLHRPELTKEERISEAERVFEIVGLHPAADVLERYPHELSGGQRQRVGFAQALSYRPKLILADEPVSMLDVSIRIGLLNVMAGLRETAGVSFLYITHDIASARYVADRLMVMYAGRIVESGPIEAVLSNPAHPYTQLLLSAVPDPRAPLSITSDTDRGEPPRVIDPGPGCRFRWRCPVAVEACATVTPVLEAVRPAHSVACHVARRAVDGRDTSPDARPVAVMANGPTSGCRKS